MRNLGRFAFAIFCLICGSIFPCISQVMPEHSKQRDYYSLYYYQDRINIDEHYLDNAFQIYRIRNILTHSPQIDSITIYAYASPEGTLSRNKWLSERRAEKARDFILANLPESSSLKPENIYLRPMGENWEGLEAELEANYHLRNRDRVLKIIHSNIPTEVKKQRLKRLDNGYTYNRIIRHHMHKLRVATWICLYTPYIDMTIDTLEVDSFKAPDTLQSTLPPIDLYERKTILALKSNLLYDVLSMANFSVEVPITKHFSALYYHQFPWWRWGEAKNEYCIRFLSIGAEGRWWFKPMPRPYYMRERDKLMGHFLGLYAESGMWDFEWKRDICHQGEHWSAGLSYGYSMPIGKYLNLELSVSAGYASIPFRKYTPSGDYEILWKDPNGSGRWHYIGPTKAQVSLVLPIMVKTKKKGGER